MKNFLQDAGEKLKRLCLGKVECDVENGRLEVITEKELIKSIKASTSPAMVVSYDTKNPFILTTNKPLRKLMGYSEKELKGQSVEIFFGKNSKGEVVRQLKENLEKNDYWQGVVTNYTKSGKEILINLLIFTVLVDGNHYYVVYKRRNLS